MAQMPACLTDQPAALTLGSVVNWNHEYGVVWHVTTDTLRVLPIAKCRTSVRLSLANEVALRLPVSLGGWCIVYDELVARPRAGCCVVGELDERFLLKVLAARNTTNPLLASALADSTTSGALHSAAAH
jgi:hypothetical protein